MRSITVTRLLAALPALALAVGALVMAASAVASNTAELPAPPHASVPEGLSPATTTHDWQEVEGTGTRLRFR
jgi:hypothetical protein